MTAEASERKGDKTLQAIESLRRDGLPTFYTRALREQLDVLKADPSKVKALEEACEAAAKSSQSQSGSLVLPHDEPPVSPAGKVHAVVVASLQKAVDVLFADCSNEKAKELQEREVKEMGLGEEQILPLTYAGVNFELFANVFCKQVLRSLLRFVLNCAIAAFAEAWRQLLRSGSGHGSRAVYCRCAARL